MIDEDGNPIGDLLVDILGLRAEFDRFYRDVPFPEDDLHHTPDDQLLLAFNALRDDHIGSAPIELLATKDGRLFDAVAHRISRREFVSYTCRVCEQELAPEEIRSEYWNNTQGWDGRVLSCPVGHLIARTIEVMT